MKPIAAAVALALLAAGSAHGEDSNRTPSGAFDLRPVATPVVVDGQVRNYIFITMRLTPVVAANISAINNKEPFFRDALVRAAFRTPFTLAGNYNRIDEAKASAAILAAAPGILGPGMLKSVSVSHQQPRNIVRAPAAAPAH